MSSDFQSLMQITPRPELVFARGSGSFLWTETDVCYLDFVQGWAVNTLGHAPEIISDALCAQAKTLLSPSPAFYNRPMIECATLLAAHSVFDQVFFANSGAEANEGAIKLARKWGSLNKGGAYQIITFHNAFHGRTLTTMAASGKAAFEPLFEPKTPGFIKVPFNDLDAVRKVISNQTVAIMLEPIQGEAGVIPAAPEFAQGLRELADEHGMLLIVDEVQTGIGRTGALFAYEHLGVEPDIMTLGKGLGGGVPISALLAKTHCCVFEPGDQGGTYNGNPLMTAVATAVLGEVLAPNFLSAVQEKEAQMRRVLEKISQHFGLGEVRGKGLLLALDTGTLDAGKIARTSLELRLLMNAPRDNTLRFMPALNVSEDEINQMAQILFEAIRTRIA